MKWLLLVLVVASLAGCSQSNGPAQAQPGCWPGARDAPGLVAPEGSVPVTVEVTNGLDGSALAGLPVTAAVFQGKLPLGLLDLNPRFNRCAVALGTTDEAGKVVFQLRPATSYVVGHDKGGNFTYEVARVDVDQAATTVDLAAYPSHISMTWAGVISGIDQSDTDPPVLLYNTEMFPPGPLVERLQSFGFEGDLSWTNSLLWGDLYLGLAAGDAAMFTDDFFNEVQAMNDGPHAEAGFAQWIDLQHSLCEVRANGLGLVVYDVEGLLAPGAAGLVGLPFEYHVEADLKGPLTPLEENKC